MKSLAQDDLREILDKLGGWPLLNTNSTAEYQFDWTNFMLKSKEIGYSTERLIDFTLTTDDSNALANRSLVCDVSETHNNT